MASIKMLVSEFAHSLGQPNNEALKENIKSLLLHTRSEIIRRSFENHRYIDKSLTQRFVVSLIDVPDGEIENDEVTKIKKTTQQVPKPIRLINNLPFDRVGTIGYKFNKEFPYIKESIARFRKYTPGLQGLPCYDYINGYIYIFPVCGKYMNLNKLVIEGVFENPNIVSIENGEIDINNTLNDDNEWLLSEDMVGQLKDIIYKRDLLQTIRETNETPNNIKF